MRRGDRYRPYVRVADRQDKAAREAARLEKKGRALAPVTVEGRAIAATFWGKAWCENLERYSDFATRLPRGRSYVRSGAVIDLQVAPGEVTALVSGSSVYQVSVKVAAVDAPRWSALGKDCAGAIDSLVDLLQGRLSERIMERVCRPATGLFPTPQEIDLDCSCPDWATMCKHVAAVLYGVGARLDRQPELLFALRRVDEKELIASAGQGGALASAPPPSARLLPSDGLAELFGIELATWSPGADGDGTDATMGAATRATATRTTRSRTSAPATPDARPTPISSARSAAARGDQPAAATTRPAAARRVKAATAVTAASTLPRTAPISATGRTAGAATRGRSVPGTSRRRTGAAGGATEAAAPPSGKRPAARATVRRRPTSDSKSR